MKRQCITALHTVHVVDSTAVAAELTSSFSAAEVYPSSVRSTAHGMSAAVGKLGALAPTILFNYISDRAKFWAVCWAGLLGFLVTVMFVPDATGIGFVHHNEFTDTCSSRIDVRTLGLLPLLLHLLLLELSIQGTA